VAHHVAATTFWEHGDLATAYRFAERALRDEPDAFRMLVICIDYYQQAGDLPRTYELAKRLLAARNPARSTRRITPLISPLFWVFGPTRGRRWLRTNLEEADTFDEWVRWAQGYVKAYEDGAIRSGT
jgi:hypothetical protein